MIDIVDLISSVGFPIVVALFFMFRMEKVIKANTEAFVILKDQIQINQLKQKKSQS